MNKQGFIDEILKRGKIDISTLPQNWQDKKWWYNQTADFVTYRDAKYGVYIDNISIRNPPTLASDIRFYEAAIKKYVEEIDSIWASERINELFVIEPTVKITFVANAQANLFIDGVSKGTLK